MSFDNKELLFVFEFTFAVDVVVGALAGVGRVQVLAAIFALVALLVPALQRAYS